MNILRWMYFFVGHPLVDGVIREERELSNIANCYKEKEDGLERRNYCRLKFTEQILKIVKRVVESLIRQQVNKNDRSFSYHHMELQKSFSSCINYRKKT